MKNQKLSLTLLSLLFLFIHSNSKANSNIDSTEAGVKPKNWSEVLSIRGYMQVRYNRLLETNENLMCEQCDRSWGGTGGLFIRRARVVFFGNVHENVYFYFQPDFASTPTSNSSLNFAQIRDAYFDISLDNKKEFRLRIGQSKVPYGFENMQSSQNRLTLDRNDALNSAVANERDIAVFFYWAPDKIRKRFSYLVRSGLKGSGDYGVFGFGVFNGQTANRPSLNNFMHTVARVSYPFEFKNKQIVEAGIQAYTGNVIVPSVSKGVLGTNDFQYKESRVAGSFVLYPQPFGLQSEYNIGVGPEYNSANNTIENKRLKGGYVQMMYMLKPKKQMLIPFTKYQYYDGGKKHELDARSYTVRDLEIGIEWQPIPNLEFVAIYTISKRRFEDSQNPFNIQSGRLLRLQAQVNF